VRVDAEGEVSSTASVFVFPNGCERDQTGALLVAETFADRVSSMSPDNVLTLHTQFEPGSGPDGLSIAPDGTIYVALAFAGALARLAPVSAGPDAHTDLVYHAEPIASGSGAGPLGVYDCAVHPDGRRIAMASLDEGLADRVDTGRIVIVDLP
jgi:hypothetical protein